MVACGFTKRQTVIDRAKGDHLLSTRFRSSIVSMISEMAFVMTRGFSSAILCN